MFKENIEGSELNLNEPADLTPEKIPHKFWYRTKDNKLKIDLKKYIGFLESLGFAKYIQDKNLIFIQIKDNIVEEVSIPHMKDYVIDTIRNFDSELLDDVTTYRLECAILAENRRLFAQGNLEFLTTRTPEFFKDTKDEAFFPFRNGLVCVTAELIKIIPYKDVSFYLWKSQLIDRDFSETDEISDFEVFIKHAMDDSPERIESLRSALGYSLHRHKDPANPKAVIFIDGRISDGSSGRSGKSLAANALGKLRKMVILDGRSFNAGKTFSFQRVKPDTNLVSFDDCRKNFPMDSMFSTFTEGWSIEEKNKPEYYIKYEDAPKPILTTNSLIGGYDDSTRARQFVVEFGSHYNAKYTPRDDFGNTFFTEWDEKEWNKFDNYMLKSVQLFLAKGLIPYQYQNLEYKRAVESSSVEYVEFIECPDNFIFNTEYDKKTLHGDFRKAFPDHEKLSQRTFTLWMKAYADIKGYEFEERRSGNDRYVKISKNEDLPF
ncbi:MAG: hypothetical protein GYA14_09515 [Ignavibacteria bacterium]|nr:hypothetical protein [Ignavibacteria bacterium]